MATGPGIGAANFVQEADELEFRMHEAKKYIGAAEANLQLRQFKRASEMLLRALADIQAADRITVERREERSKR